MRLLASAVYRAGGCRGEPLGRATTEDERWSDHAPVTVHFDRY